MIKLQHRRSACVGMLFSLLVIEPMPTARSAPAAPIQCSHVAQLQQAAEIFRILTQKANWTDKAEYNSALRQFNVIAPDVFASLGPIGKGQLQELLRVLSAAWSERKEKDIALYSIQTFQFLRAASVQQATHCLN